MKFYDLYYERIVSFIFHLIHFNVSSCYSINLNQEQLDLWMFHNTNKKYDVL